MHDHGLPLVLVGHSCYHDTLLSYLAHHQVQKHTIEWIESQSQDWIQSHQFFFATSNLAWKQEVCTRMNRLDPQWCSVINQNSAICESTVIGRNVFVNNLNTIMDQCIIHDHSCVTNHCALMHHVSVGAGSHIGPMSYANWTELGKFTCTGVRTSFLGSTQSPVQVVDNCNIMANSVIRRNITESGTWLNHRLLDSHNSLQRRFF